MSYVLSNTLAAARAGDPLAAALLKATPGSAGVVDGMTACGECGKRFKGKSSLAVYCCKPCMRRAARNRAKAASRG